MSKDPKLNHWLKWRSVWFHLLKLVKWNLYQSRSEIDKIQVFLVFTLKDTRSHYSWTWNTDLWHSLPWLIFFLDYWRNLNCFNCFWDCLLYFCLHPTLSVLTFFFLVSFSKWWAITENGFWPKSFFHDSQQTAEICDRVCDY